MPEFILDHGTLEAARAFKALDSFTQGYIEAMFFTDTGTGDDEGLEDATVADLAPETVERITKDCAAFQAYAKAWLQQAYEGDYDEAQAGRDFWFTRNGHGVGFWDREQLRHTAWHRKDSLGDALSEVSKRWHEVSVYAGDDGQIYLM